MTDSSGTGPRTACQTLWNQEASPKPLAQAGDLRQCQTLVRNWQSFNFRFFKVLALNAGGFGAAS